MSEDTNEPLEGLLKLIEGLQKSSDSALYSNKSCIKLLKSLTNVLGNGVNISTKDADRVLKICLQYKNNLQYVPHVFGIISLLINIDKAKPFVPEANFAQSALAVVEFLHQMSAENQINHMQILAFRVLISHPVDTLTKLVQDHCSDIIQIFNLYINSDNLSLEAKMNSFLLLKLLDVLPSTEKMLFVKAGIPQWLSGGVTNLIDYLVISENWETQDEYLMYTELLTQQLVLLNYYKYPEFQDLLTNICDQNKFPASIKHILELGRSTWHRIWIVLIKLLKNYTTLFSGKFGTPINLLLPVVELAFKMDPVQKVRAFECWSEVVENFSPENGDGSIGKRVKLLMTPLKLNNAKTEDTVSAKFDTWWVFIRRFKLAMKDFSQQTFVPFLHFLFGKELKGHQSNPKQYLSGHKCHSLQRRCLEAFVEIVGHHAIHCQCSLQIEPLNGQVMTSAVLVENWDACCYALTCAVQLAASIDTPPSRANIQCIWRSTLAMVASTPHNTVKNDLFNKLMKLLSQLTKDCSGDGCLMKLLIQGLILPLLSEEWVGLLISDSKELPLHRIARLCMDQAMKDYYQRFCNKELTELLSPIASLLLHKSVQNIYMITFLDNLPQNDWTLKLWMCLISKMTNSKEEISDKVARNVLKWPLKSLSAHNDVKLPALTWYNYYCTGSYSSDTELNKELAEMIIEGSVDSVDSMPSTNYFAMFALIGVLKHYHHVDAYKKLEDFTSKMCKYKEYDQLIPPLIDTLGVMLDHVITVLDQTRAEITFNCVKYIVRVLCQKNTESPIGDKESTPVMSLMLGTLIRTTTPLFKVDAYSSMSCELVNELSSHLQSMGKDFNLSPIVMPLNIINSVCANESVKRQLNNLMTSLKMEEKDRKETHKAIVKVFASPNAKKNKKELSIINTVFENGEEYVVVKNNWKFNPNKLTDKQKENFQKKREIPALYQDLSQSQDEFKLSAWKTESQDTSLSSNSKSALNNKASEIIKTMPCTDVVPTIIENILMDKDARLVPKGHFQLTKETGKETLPKEEKLPAPKETKSPRMAFKDRLLKNVKVLIDGSVLHADNKNRQDDQNQIANVVTSAASPVSRPIRSISILNSTIQEDLDRNKNILPTTATSIITPITKQGTNSHTAVDRPFRNKKTPKKFNDSELFGLKKKRIQTAISSNYSQDKSQEEVVVDVTVAEIHTQNNKNNSFDVHDVQALNVNLPGDSMAMPETNERSDVDLDLHNVTKPLSHITITNDTNSNHDNLLNSYTDHKADDVLLTTTKDSIQCELAVNLGEVNNMIHMKTGITSSLIPIKKYIATNDTKQSKGNNLKETAFNLEPPQIGTEKLANIGSPLEMILTPSNKHSKDRVAKTSIDKIDKLRRKSIVTVVRNEIIKYPKICKTNDKTLKTDNSKESHITSHTSSNIDGNECNINEQSKSINEKRQDKSDIKDNDTIEAEICYLKESNSEKSVKLFNKPTKGSDFKSVIETGFHKNTDGEMMTINTTQTPKNKNKVVDEKSTPKKTSKTSRINKSLMIDTVEGHPLLKMQSEKRLTRKQIAESETISTRNSSENCIKSKIERTPKSSKKPRDKKASPTLLNTVPAVDSQDRQSTSSLDSYIEEPYSEDIIESSQDSTLTTVSANSVKPPLQETHKIHIKKMSPQKPVEIINISDSENQDSRNDIEFPLNKTAVVDNELTENMDTEPMSDKTASVDVVTVSGSEPVITLQTESVGSDSQEIAEAETQPNPSGYMEGVECGPIQCNDTELTTQNEINTTNNDVTQTLPDVALTVANIKNTTQILIPHKDDDQRKQDFLNNTLEISPIKVSSPDRDKKSPSPETSKDFVVITLSSPVNSNGEPFEKNGSPVFFSEDKVSPDNRDVSPPRADQMGSSSSPSSSLSLKKNRPPVKPGGRAAQMIGLLGASEMRQPGTSTPARQNLRALYNCPTTVGDSNDDDLRSLTGEDVHNFLKLKRSLPSIASSPSGPILKRKLAEIEEAAVSPATKRKRVSFHDPPVSTTVSVHKYIDPISTRSPQSSLKKRFDRKMRPTTKSPKRLENSFHLDTVLSNTIDSFSQNQTLTDDTQNSLEVTPPVEIVKTSEMNDTDPICPDLVDCKHPIDVIGKELSSTAMRDSFIKELQGAIETVADLAKMTELEVNRLCIKAPKIKVAKKVLTEYAAKIAANKCVDSITEEAFSETITGASLDRESADGVQAAVDDRISDITPGRTRTEATSTTDRNTLTDASQQTTTDGLKSDGLAAKNLQFEKMDCKSIEEIPFETVLGWFEMKMKGSNANNETSMFIEQSSIISILLKKYKQNDLLLFCSELTKRMHDNPALPND